MKLSMSNIAWTFEERQSAYKLLSELGFSGVEIAPGLLFADCDDPFRPARNKIKERLEELQGNSLAFCSMQSLLFGKGNCKLFENGMQRNSMMAELKTAIDLAYELTIRNIVFGSPKARNIPETMSTEQAEEIAESFFIELAAFAKERNVVIALEANPEVYGTNFLNRFSQTVDLATKLDHEAIKVNLDVGSFILNENQDDMSDAFKRSFGHVNHIHVSSPFLAPTPNEAHVACIEDLLNSVKHSSYDNFISIEMRRHDTGLVKCRDLR